MKALLPFLVVVLATIALCDEAEKAADRRTLYGFGGLALGCLENSDCKIKKTFCNHDGLCVAKKGLGKRCSQGFECETGFCNGWPWGHCGAEDLGGHEN